MQVTNVVVSKTDANVENVAINVSDTNSSDNDVTVIVDYSSLTTGEKATVDAFYALALAKVPA